MTTMALIPLFALFLAGAIMHLRDARRGAGGQAYFASGLASVLALCVGSAWL